MARGLPQAAGQDDRRLDLVVAVLVLHLLPVLHEGVADAHAVGQPEREAGTSLVHHEDLHLLADLPVVALLRLLAHVLPLRKLILAAEGDAIDAGEHLVVLVALPIRARDAGELEGLERLGVEDMRANAHVDVLALLVEGDAGVLGKVADVLYLVLLATLLHVGNGLGAGQLVGLELEVLLADLGHLGLDLGEVLLGDLGALGQVDVVVEAVLGCGAKGKVRLGIQALDGLGHDVSRRVAHDVKLLVLGALAHVTVVVENLHVKPLPWGSSPNSDCKVTLRAKPGTAAHNGDCHMARGQVRDSRLDSHRSRCTRGEKCVDAASIRGLTEHVHVARVAHTLMTPPRIHWHFCGRTRRHRTFASRVTYAACGYADS